MDCCTGIIESDDLEVLEDPGSFGGIKRNRSCTDKSYLFGMAGFFFILFGFLGYCIANGDLDRIFSGYDDCGNVCGKNNIKTDSEPYECFGKNMEDKKYLLYQFETKYDDIKYVTTKYVTKTCVKDCKEHGAYVDFLNRCYPNSSKNSTNITANNLFQQLIDDLQICWKPIILLSFLALVFSIIMMVLMRYATAFLVWFVLISISLLFIGLTTYLWILFKQASDENNMENYGLFLQFAIFATIFTVIFLLIILIMGKRIKLVIQLFKEAAKAFAALPLLLFQPVLTFFVLIFILFMSVYTTMWVTSSGYLGRSLDDFDLNKDHPRSLDYIMSSIGIFTSWYNFVAILWIIQFVIGCQHFIIAGCVATWFYARNKDHLGAPIIASTMNLLRYHLGTIAFGSLIITIVQVIRTFISYLRSAVKNKNNIVLALIWCCCSYIVEIIEEFLKYFTRNAYIITAIYGQPFCKSGKRALTLLVNNLFKVIVINSVGDYVLFFIKLFVTVTTILVGTEIFRQNDQIHNLWFPILIVGCISFFIAHCFITVFEMAIDTIFLCFCEDCEHNDGLSKPYYMSRNLMEFVEKSSVSVKAYNWDVSQQQAWDNGPKRILQQSH